MLYFYMTFRYMFSIVVHYLAVFVIALIVGM